MLGTRGRRAPRDGEAGDDVSARATAGDDDGTLGAHGRRATGPAGSGPTGDVQEDARREHGDDERGAAVADERKGDALVRERADRDADVEHRLQPDPGGDADGQQRALQLTRSSTGGDPGDHQREEQADHEDAAHQPELLADDGEDEVGVRLGEEPPLGSALTEPDPEQPARGQADLGLQRLEAPVVGVLPRIEERQHPAPPEAPHRGHHAEADHGHGQPGQHVEAAAGDGEHDEHHREQQHRRAEVGLGHHQQGDQRGDRERRQHRHLPVGDARLASRQQPGQPQDDRQLDDLGGLEPDGARAQPALGAVDLVAERGEHQEERDDRDDERERPEPDPEDDGRPGTRSSTRRRRRRGSRPGGGRSTTASRGCAAPAPTTPTGRTPCPAGTARRIDPAMHQNGTDEWRVSATTRRRRRTGASTMVVTSWIPPDAAPGLAPTGRSRRPCAA